MRWFPWSERHQPAPVADDITDAVAAREHAEAALERERGRSREVREVAATSRRSLAANHFAQLIAETFGR